MLIFHTLCGAFQNEWFYTFETLILQVGCAIDEETKHYTLMKYIYIFLILAKYPPFGKNLDVFIPPGIPAKDTDGVV